MREKRSISAHRSFQRYTVATAVRPIPLALPTPLLRLRTDEQLLGLFRLGREDAFRALHDRYHDRLLAYVRHMLRGHADAEDVVQDVFERAYGALRAGERDIAVRPWLYRVAHNRCIDYVRRAPTPPLQPDELLPGGIDPVAVAEQREDLRRLVADLHALPAPQRSALIIRELEGLSYAELATALEVTVPAVKSLLVRARSGLVEAAEARDTDCAVIRDELALAVDRAGRPPRLLRDHLRICSSCRAHRQALRHGHAQLASLLPAPSSLLLGGWLATLLGSGGSAGGAAAAGSSIAAGATKVLAVASASVAVAGGAAEVAPRPAEPARPRGDHDQDRGRRAARAPAHAHRRRPPRSTTARARAPGAGAASAERAGDRHHPGPRSGPGRVRAGRRRARDARARADGHPDADPDPHADRHPHARRHGDRRRRPPSRRLRRRLRPSRYRRPNLRRVSGEHDFDWLVIGSGFGGSVSALRLAEKGYRVAVLESGRRYEDEDFAETTWNARRYYWLPRLGLRGIFRMTLFKDVFVVSGCGVGGGSLGYANTLYRPRPGSAFYRDPQWGELEDWEAALGPHYDTAERMLGVTTYEGEGPADTLLRDLATEMGVPETYSTTRVGVFFGEPGETVADPYFGGEGPPRAGCIRCGACMVGCRHNAKNTLVKNYLWFAERKGVRVLPERTVAEIRPLGAPDGSGGYAVTSDRSGAWVRKDRQVLTAGGVVVAAGALGTNQLLQRCRLGGSLPRLSERIGHLVRTNSEAITAVTTKDDRHDFTKSIAITSSFYPDPDTHIENVTYGPGADSISFLFTILTAAGTSLHPPARSCSARRCATRSCSPARCGPAGGRGAR